MKSRGRRSTLSKPQARKRYIEAGEALVLEQIQRDARTLAKEPIAVGPFARLDASAVAAKDGKTRGSVTNLFGSQAAFQVETMSLALSASTLVESVVFPAPQDYRSADEWVGAFFAAQSARGPQHNSKPTVNYAFLWALWLSAVPYGLWSEEISKPSLDEYVLWVRRLETTFSEAIEHFGLALRPGTTINDLAASVASFIEGVWINQCLTSHHPCDPSEPIASALSRGGKLIWLGATISASRTLR